MPSITATTSTQSAQRMTRLASRDQPSAVEEDANRASPLLSSLSRPLMAPRISQPSSSSSQTTTTPANTDEIRPSSPEIVTLDLKQEPAPLISTSKPKASPAEEKTHKRKKSNGMVAFLTLKEPSSKALQDFANAEKAKAKQKGVKTPLSSQKLPEFVPKVNSKWDGLPDSAPRKSIESRAGRSIQSRAGRSIESRAGRSIESRAGGAVTRTSKDSKVPPSPRRDLNSPASASSNGGRFHSPLTTAEPSPALEKESVDFAPPTTALVAQSTDTTPPPSSLLKREKPAPPPLAINSQTKTNSNTNNATTNAKEAVPAIPPRSPSRAMSPTILEMTAFGPDRMSPGTELSPSSYAQNAAEPPDVPRGDSVVSTASSEFYQNTKDVWTREDNEVPPTPKSPGPRNFSRPFPRAPPQGYF